MQHWNLAIRVSFMCKIRIFHLTQKFLNLTL